MLQHTATRMAASARRIGGAQRATNAPTNTCHAALRVDLRPTLYHANALETPGHLSFNAQLKRLQLAFGAAQPSQKPAWRLPLGANRTVVSARIGPLGPCVAWHRPTRARSVYTIGRAACAASYVACHMPCCVLYARCHVAWSDTWLPWRVVCNLRVMSLLCVQMTSWSLCAGGR